MRGIGQQISLEELPKGKISQARDIVVDHLRTKSLSLERYVRTWVLNDGTNDTGMSGQPADYTADMMPLFKLELGGGDIEWFNEVTQKTHVHYTVILGTAGNDQRKLTDFWEVLVNRLYPGDQSLYIKLKPLGVMSYSLTLTGVSRQRLPDNEWQIAICDFVLYHEVRTKY